MIFSAASGIDDSLGEGLQLGEDSVHRRARPEVLVVDLVYLEARRGAAGSQALRLAESPRSVALARLHPQFLLEVGEQVLRPPQTARAVGADVHHELARLPRVEHHVEGGDL